MLWKNKYKVIIYSLDIYNSWKSIISITSTAVSRYNYIILVNLLQLYCRINIIFKIELKALFIY